MERSDYFVERSDYLWNEVTIFWNEVTVRWNEVTWNEVTMERSDRIPYLVNVSYLRVFHIILFYGRVAIQRNPFVFIQCHGNPYSDPSAFSSFDHANKSCFGELFILFNRPWSLALYITKLDST